MPLAQFAHTVDDLIAGVIVQPFRHSKIVLPGGQRLLAAAIKILFLPLQIIFDLHQAHSVCDKHQILGADPFLLEPMQHFIGYALACLFFKLQPGQGLCVSVQLAQAAEFLGVQAQSTDQSRLVRMQHQFPHIIAETEALRCQPGKSSFPNLLHLGKPFPNRQIFFGVGVRMAAYPLGQAGMAKFIFLQTGQSFPVHPAGLIASIGVIARAPCDPSCFPLAVHSPVIGTNLAAVVINRTPELMPIRLAVWQPVLSVGPVRPEFPDNKTILAPLDQIGIILICLEIACASQCLEHHRMPAAGTASLFVVVGVPGNGHLLPAEGAVAGFCAAALVVVKYKIFPHGHLVGPTPPIFRQFRNLRQILVPRVGNPFVVPIQLLIPHIPLKIENAEGATALAGKICLHQILVLFASPACGVVSITGPFQPIQFCVTPFLL